MKSRQKPATLIRSLFRAIGLLARKQDIDAAAVLLSATLSTAFVCLFKCISSVSEFGDNLATSDASSSSSCLSGGLAPNSPIYVDMISSIRGRRIPNPPDTGIQVQVACLSIEAPWAPI